MTIGLMVGFILGLIVGWMVTDNWHVIVERMTARNKEDDPD